MSSQPLEMHRGCALSGRLHAGAATTQHTRKPRQELSCARQVPAHPCTSPSSSPEPVAAVGQLSLGCLTPWQVQQKQPSLTARSSAPSCWDNLPAHSPTTLEAQTGAEAPPAQGGLGV